VAVLENRAVQALRRPANWVQLAKFGVVRSATYQPGGVRRGARPGPIRRPDLVRRRRQQLLVEPPLDVRRLEGSFAPAPAFSSSRSRLWVNQLWLLVFIDWLGWGKVVSQAIAIVLVTPLNFLGNKLWSFRR
jgi:hypothetical protein